MAKKTTQSRSHNESSYRQSRRSFLLTTGSAVTASISLFAAPTSAQSVSRESYTIREGTDDATEVYVIDSGCPGPTAVVVGGLHGNEEAGYLAADDVAEWTIDEGKLVVLPRANPTAIERHSYENENGNLNRKFPTGQRPTTPLARAIWNVVTGHNADLVLSLHSSKGIYQEEVGPEGDGQAIYPTTAPGAEQDAARTADYMNRSHLKDSRPDYYRFKQGNTLDGSRPLLIHKVAGDLHKPGFILETTTYETMLDTRIRWELNMVRHLLRRHQIDRV